MGTDVNPDISKDSDKTVSGSDDTFSGNTPLGSQPNNSPDKPQESENKNKAELTTFKTREITKLISQIDTLREGLNAKYITSIQFSEVLSKLNDINSVSKFEKLQTKIEEIQTGIKKGSPESKKEDPNPSITSLNNKLGDIVLSSRYNHLFFILPPCVLLAALLVLGFFVKPLSMDPVNERIEKLSINITENSPKSQINKLKEDITGIKNSFDEVNKKGVSEIKELIAKTGNLTTFSENINALKTSVDALSANPLNKKDLDDIKTLLKTLGDNKSTIIPPQLIGQPIEASKFAKELLAELIKSKGFTDEISKSSNQATKEALKSVDDKIKLISDSIKINPKTDKTEDILKSIDGNFKSILESINKNPKQVISKPNHPFLLICSTTPSFNPVKLEKLGPMFRELTDTVLKKNSNIEWKIGIEYAGNFNSWFENDKELKLPATSYSQASPDYTTNFLNSKILVSQLKNDILSDVIIIVPPGAGDGLKTNAGTPIFMNGVRVHVVYLLLASNKVLLSDSMIEWAKLSAFNAGGVFSVLRIAETRDGVIDEIDLQKQLKEHLVRIVHKFN